MPNSKTDFHFEATPYSHYVTWGTTRDGMSGPSEMRKSRFARLSSGEILLIADPQGNSPPNLDLYLTDKETAQIAISTAIDFGSARN